VAHSRKLRYWTTFIASHEPVVAKTAASEQPPSVGKQLDQTQRARNKQRNWLDLGHPV